MCVVGNQPITRAWASVRIACRNFRRGHRHIERRASLTKTCAKRVTERATPVLRRRRIHRSAGADARTENSRAMRVSHFVDRVDQIQMIEHMTRI